MSTQVQATDTQQALFGQWAQGTKFQLDLDDSPKRQFNILAKLLGWIGGEEPWNANWLACFEEDYIWRAFGPLTDISAAVPGVSNEKSTSTDSATPPPSNDGGSISDHGDNPWYKFKGFQPKSTNTFNFEFRRLSKYMGWTETERRVRRVELFDADFERHFGRDIGDLEQWQKFCHLCSIAPNPDTIPGCMKALKQVLVNIYDLLDHKRTGVPIVPFDDFLEFAEYTRDGRIYPLKEAKDDTFLPVFLKVLNSIYHRR